MYFTATTVASSSSSPPSSPQHLQLPRRRSITNLSSSNSSDNTNNTMNIKRRLASRRSSATNVAALTSSTPNGLPSVKTLILSVIVGCSLLRLAALIRIFPQRFIMEYHSPSLVRTRMSIATKGLSGGSSSMISSRIITNEHPIVFYHIHAQPQDIETSTTSVDVAAEQLLDHVQEQLQTVFTSHRKAFVLYNLAPLHDDDIQSAWERYIEESCPDERCIPLLGPKEKEVPQEHTLFYLHQYCEDHPTEIVTYINNQYYNSNKNKNKTKQDWKHHLLGTEAALKCHDFLGINGQEQHRDQCTSCGWHFETRPSHQYRTNQWTAPCSYIKSLASPKEYPIKLQVMYHLLNTKEEYKCLRPQNITTSKRLSPSFLGVSETGLYASGTNAAMAISTSWPSRWIHSHPSLQPCDAMEWSTQPTEELFLPSTTRSFLGYTDIVRRKKDEGDPQEERQPKPSQHDINQHLIVPQWKLHLSPQTSHFHKRGAPTSWQRLDGRLFEWNFVNKKHFAFDSSSDAVNNKGMLRPNNDSWVYTFYNESEHGIKCYKNYLSNEFWTE